MIGPRRSVAERQAQGRAARGHTPRRSHAALGVDRAGRDPIAILRAQDRTRVPELLELRYERTSVSPFTYLRGQAAVMAADLAAGPRTALLTQLCGDAHLGNFGLFASPERRLVFDLNDFDETLPGPFEWDVKRLVASLEVTARDRGHAIGTGEEAVRTCIARYRDTMQEAADAGVLATWYAGVDVSGVRRATEDATQEGSVPAKVGRRAERIVERARRRDHRQAVDRLTESVDGTVRFLEQPPVLSAAALGPERRELAVAFLHRYARSLPGDRRQLLERFTVIDAARRVVGVGSVGTRCHVILLHGRDEQDPLVLQVKEAGPSVLEAHLGASRRVPAGRRVVEGQRIMQAASDAFLGWVRAPGADGVERDHYVRQFRDWKGDVPLDRISAPGLVAYAGWCGVLLAQAHARGGDAIAIAAYLGRARGLADAMVAFATG